MELFYITMGIVLGWVVGRMYMIYELRHTIKFLKDRSMITIAQDEEKTDLPYYRVESHGSSFYLFDMKNVFICQAKSIDDLATSLYSIAAIKQAFIKYNEEILLFREGRVTRFLNESKHR